MGKPSTLKAMQDSFVGLKMYRWEYIRIATEELGVEIHELAEIGVDTGMFTFHARRYWPNAIMHLVDPWEDYEDYRKPSGGNTFKTQIEANGRFNKVYLRFGSDPNVKIWRMMSTQASAEIPNFSLDLVFIDANHSYEYAKIDIKEWLPKVRPGGLLTGHDYYGYNGVRKAVDELLPRSVVASGKNKGDVWIHIA